MLQKQRKSFKYLYISIIYCNFAASNNKYGTVSVHKDIHFGDNAY